MSYIISEDGKELLKDVRDFCVNEVKGAGKGIRYFR